MSQEKNSVQKPTHRLPLRDLLCVLFRHRGKGLLFFSVTVACATAMVLYAARNLYRSEAQLAVKMADARSDADTAGELTLLRSREVGERVVDMLGEAAFQQACARPRLVPNWVRLPESPDDPTTPPTRDEVIDHLTRAVTLSTGGSSDKTIRLGYEAPDPNFAQRVLETFVEAYFEEHALVNVSIVTDRGLADEVNKTRTRLAQMESELLALMDAAGISDYDAELQIKLAHIGLIEQQIQKALTDRAGSAARIDKLAKRFATLPDTILTSATTGLPNSTADDLRSQIHTLQLVEQDYLTKYSADSRQVTDIRQRITAAEELLDQQESTLTQITHSYSRTRETVAESIVAQEATQSALEAEIMALAQNLKAAKTDIARMNNASVAIKQLGREVQVQEGFYLTRVGRLEQARLDRTTHPDVVAGVNLLLAATLPTHPLRPNVALIIALAALLGLLGSTALAFIAESANHAIKTPEGAQKALQLQTLVSVPRTRSNTVRATRRKHNGKEDGNLAWDVPPEVKDQFEQLSEQLLKASKSPSAKKRVIGITSSLKGEGVSVVAANVAALLATQKRVLLIDTHVDHPSLPDIFDMKVTLGLLDVISNTKARKLAIWNSPVENLDVMPVGTHKRGRQDLNHDDLKKLITLLKRDYDCIVLDLPPINEAGDSARLASLCDSVSLIVDAERSRREVVREAQKQLARREANVLGVVLNKRRFPLPNWIYNSLA